MVIDNVCIAVDMGGSIPFVIRNTTNDRTINIATTSIDEAAMVTAKITHFLAAS